MEKFYHGQKVTCRIMGIEIVDAKISINKAGIPFICQNYMKGINPEDSLGYRYGWSLNKDFTGENVSNLIPFALHMKRNVASGHLVRNDRGGVFTVLEVWTTSASLENKNGGIRMESFARLEKYYTLLAKKTLVWEPKLGKPYCFISAKATLESDIWMNNKRDIDRRDFLGIYKNDELARAALLEIRRKLGK